MKTVFMGSPFFAIPALHSLISNKCEITAVYTQPDRRTGRGQQVMSCPVKRFAVSHGLRVIQPETFKDQREIELLAELKPDIVIVAAYGQILPDAILNLPKYKCLNIHPSLLPKYRGPSPVAAAILNGDAVTGVTIMLIERKVDSGPILIQIEMPIEDEDTAESLSEKLAKAGAELLIETIAGWVSGRIEPQTQVESNASYTKMAVKEDGELDWKLPAIQLWRKVRAYHPWPGCYTNWKGARLRIMKAIVVLDRSGVPEGEVKALPRTAPARIAVQTGEGLLGLITVQPEGKREMSAVEFIAGHRDFVGSIL